MSPFPHKAIVELPGGHDCAEVELYRERPLKGLLGISPCRRYVSLDGKLINFFTRDNMVDDVCRGSVIKATSGEHPYSLIQSRCSSTSLRRRVINTAGRRFPAFQQVIESALGGDSSTHVSKRLERIKNGDCLAADKVRKREISGSIVLVLESPHKDEYFYYSNSLIPLVPANGDTGAKIHKYLPRVLHELDERCSGIVGSSIQNQAPLIICNPIPYQVSLFFFRQDYDLDDSLRDSIWLKLWKIKAGDRLPFQDFFIQRMSDYEPAIIINACTSGVQKHVSSVLSSRMSSIPSCDIYHPSMKWPTICEEGNCPCNCP